MDRTRLARRRRDSAAGQRVLRRVLPALRRSEVRARSARAHCPGHSRGPQEREDRFRTADLPLLFCSPTMELGVDIAQLNVVNLRNVPPTPANYAQRSGRAGRGGQPALVYTYCAGRSPHDQYYFRQPEADGGGLGRRPADRPAQQRSGSLACPRDLDGGGQAGSRQDAHDRARHPARRTAGSSCRSKTSIKRELREPVAPGRGARASRTSSSPAFATTWPGARWFHDNWAREALDQIELSFDERLRALAQSLSVRGPAARAAPQDHRRPRAAGRRAQPFEAPAGAGREPDPLADGGRRASTRAISTRIGTSPRKVSCPATTSRACRFRPMCRAEAPTRAATSSCHARASWRFRSSVRARWSITRARATASLRSTWTSVPTTSRTRTRSRPRR